MSEDALSRAAREERDRNVQRSRDKHAKLAEIGEIPAVVNPERKERCRNDLHEFLVTYFPESTGLSEFSKDHKDVIGRLQRVIQFGGRFIATVYRGWAKTTIAENSCIWALLYGHAKFIPLLGADKEAADNNLDSIKTELSSNPLLLEDFPEACYPIQKLEGRPQRCQTQTANGELTHIGWTADDVVLPTIPGSDASGGCIRTKGLMAANRGMTHKSADGKQRRPDFVFVDDPQTDESAESPAQVDKRIRKLNKTVLKLAGHTKALSIFVAATVIKKNDMPDQLMDPEKNPSWQSRRIKMVHKWADKHESMWLGKYAEIRNNYDRQAEDDQRRAHREATHFYDTNREEMDRGCEVAWENCYYDDDDEISAVQHAYNMLIDDGPEVFASECQNEPLDDEAMSGAVRPDEVLSQITPVKRGRLPVASEHLVPFIDVQGSVLYWGALGWWGTHNGIIADYGVWPEQERRNFTLKSMTNTLANKYPDADRSGSVYNGLIDLIDYLMSRVWPLEEKGRLGVSKIIVDAGHETDAVRRACNDSKHRSSLLYSFGVGVTAGRRPLVDPTRKSKQIERTYDHCYVRRDAARGNPYLRYDTNYWKTKVARGLSTPWGSAGSIGLYSTKNPSHHYELAQQLSAEYPTETFGNGRAVTEWRKRPSYPDNHLLDILVGSAAGASTCGVDARNERPANRRRRRRGHVSKI